MRIIRHSTIRQQLCNIDRSTNKFHYLAIANNRRRVERQLAAFYCSQVKKDDIAIKTVKRSDLFQEELVKRTHQLQEKKQKIKENIRDTRSKVREKVEEAIERNDFAIKAVKNTELLQEALVKRKQQIQENIRDTRTKVREKVEEVIERENIFTIPNALCIGRIAMSPYLGYVIIQGDFPLAVGLMVAAGLTDFADGYIARNWKGQKSNFGSFLDPLADKCLMATLVVSLGYCNLMPLWLASMIIFRDVFLIAAAFVIRYKSLPDTHRTLTRYFDASHVTAQLAPTFTSKVNTGVQLFVVAASLGAPVFNYIDHPVLQGLWYLTGVTTLAAAISYMVKKDTYKYLRREMKRK